MTSLAGSLGACAWHGFVDVPTHQQFRILSVEQRRSGQQLLIEAVNDLFRKYGKEPIAQ